MTRDPTVGESEVMGVVVQDKRKPGRGFFQGTLGVCVNGTEGGESWAPAILMLGSIPLVISTPFWTWKQVRSGEKKVPLITSILNWKHGSPTYSF